MALGQIKLKLFQSGRSSAFCHRQSKDGVTEWVYSIALSVAFFSTPIDLVIVSNNMN